MKLTTALQRMRNTPGLRADLVIVAVLLACGLGVTGYLFANYHVAMPWSHRYTFSAEFDQAPAIQLASREEVRIAGVPVGAISDAAVAADGNAKVTFSIDSGHPVYKNATLILRSKTPLNVMYVTLNPGDPSAGALPEGGTIPVQQTQRVLQPYELLDQLDDRARAALTDLVTEADVAMADAPRDLPPALGALHGTAMSFSDVAAALQKRRANLRHLVTSVSQIANAAGSNDTRLRELVSSLTTTLKVVSGRDRDLGVALTRLPGVTTELSNAMRHTRGLTSELSPVLRQLHQASGDLPGAISRLASTVRNAKDVVVAARPVVHDAVPVVADLRPLVANLSTALGDVVPVADNLPRATQMLTPWLTNLGAFVYNTSSSFSLGDVNGGLGRADVVLRLDQPTGGGLR